MGIVGIVALPKRQSQVLSPSLFAFAHVTHLSRYHRVVRDCECQPRGCVVKDLNGVERSYKHGDQVYNDCREKVVCLCYGLMVVTRLLYNTVHLLVRHTQGLLSRAQIGRRSVSHTRWFALGLTLQLFAALSTAERTAFINAWKTVSTALAYKPAFDALVNLHFNNFGSGIHMSTERSLASSHPALSALCETH